MAATTLIPRLAAGLGASTLVLTNAAGGLHRSMSPGQLMLITDHLNLMPANPLTGWLVPGRCPAFVDLTHVYDPALMAAAHRVAQETGVVLPPRRLRSLVRPVVRDPRGDRDAPPSGCRRRWGCPRPRGGGRRPRASGPGHVVHHERRRQRADP